MFSYSAAGIEPIRTGRRTLGILSLDESIHNVHQCGQTVELHLIRSSATPVSPVQHHGRPALALVLNLLQCAQFASITAPSLAAPRTSRLHSTNPDLSGLQRLGVSGFATARPAAQMSPGREAPIHLQLMPTVSHGRASTCPYRALTLSVTSQL